MQKNVIDYNIMNKSLIKDRRNITQLINKSLEQQNSSIKKRSNDLYDSAPISNSAHAYYKTEQLIGSLECFNGKEVGTLQAENNVLRFSAGNYRYMCKDRSSLLLTQKDGLISTDFAYLHEKYNITSEQFSDNYLANHRKYATFLHYLQHDTSGIMLRQEFTKEEHLEVLGSLGITPGWFTIETEFGNSYKAYLTEDGEIYPEYDIESTRESLNSQNWLNNSTNKFTKDTIFLIDGKEYKLDDNGYLHIPKGTQVIGFKVIY